jgi:uncharacterized CHY-type Zn-finger protein
MKVESYIGCFECGIDDGNKVRFDRGGDDEYSHAVLCGRCLRRALKMLKHPPKVRPTNDADHGRPDDRRADP